MKKLLSLLVASVMVLGMVTTMYALPQNTAKAADVTKDVTMNVNVWNRCGFDRYGRPLYDGKYTQYSGVTVNADGTFAPTTQYPTYDATSGVFVPWQSEGEVIWGRVGFLMPNASYAIRNDGSGRYNRPVNNTSPANWTVTPYLYTEAWLTVKASGGESQLYDHRYIIMDNLGQVWIDPDGSYNDCRYWDPANPTSGYYRSSTILSGDNSAQWNDCFTNPKMLVDPSGDNNTQGPYIFNSQYNKTAPIQDLPSPNYHEKVYYWWYDEGKGIDRVWRLGWANMNDYLRRDGICADGVHTSSGIVGNFPNSYYPGKPVLWNSLITDPVSRRWTPNDQNIIANDWDAGLSILGFSTSEKYIDANGDGNWQYGEPIFLDPDNNGFDQNDTRLISYTIQWGGRAFNFREQTDVGPADEDLQWYIARSLTSNTFPANIAHGSLPGVSLYNQIYQNNDGDNFVSPGDYRLTNINKRYTGFGLTSGGFFQGDTIIMLELLYTTCSEKYNVHVQSDLWMIMQKDTLQNPEMAPSRTAAAFYSSNGDINSMAQLINKATALDVDGKTFYVPTTTFFDVQLQYREYLGLQLFLDNGVDNNIAEGGKCYALSLSDDHINFEAGEQYVGSKKVEKAMDIDLPMTQFPEIYLYNEINYNMEPGQFPTPVPVDIRYGCGETIYKDINRTPYNPGQPLQPDPALVNYNPGIVNVGDQRMMDIKISSATATGDAGTIVTYKAGSFVVDGDLDVGRPLIKLENGVAFYDEPHDCAKPNSMYDVGELVYYDPALAGGARSVRMIGWQDPADNGIERFEPATWSNTGNPTSTAPFAGADGGSWINLPTGLVAAYPYNWPYIPINGVTVRNPPGNPPYGVVHPTSFDRQNYSGSWRLRGYSTRYNYRWPIPPNPYPYAPNAGVLYYNGLDGDNPQTPATGSNWNKYVFNFDYIFTHQTPYYSRHQGIAAVYMQPNNTGYGAMAFYCYYNYSSYGFHRGSNYTRLHIFRYDSGPGWATVYPLQYFDPANTGMIIPSGTQLRIRTTVVSNVWTIMIPTWGAPIIATLTGGNTYGSVGFPMGGSYSYNAWVYEGNAYWDNVDVYRVEKVPEPGDRIRLLSPGHYVGMNGFVLRKNDATEIKTNSTNDMAFKPFGYFYPCGTKLAAGEVYDVESQVGMVTMGKCGDPRYMDIEVLPGKVKVNVDVDGIPADPNAAYHLKVEQTSDIKVSVDPAPKPGEKYIVKVTDVYQSGIPATPARVDYVESFENNTFTTFDKGQVELPKETFNTTSRLYFTYSDCASAQQSDYLMLPWNFPFYYETAAAGTKIEVSWAGWITFMGLPPVGQCKYAGTYGSPGTYSWNWMQGAYDWTISACSFFQDLGWSPLSGQQANPNLGVWLSWPTSSEFKIRWASHSYWAGDNDPATVNYSITIDRDGNIRLSYGEMNSQDWVLQYYTAAVGITGYRTQDSAQYKNSSYSGSAISALDYVDDVILTRTEFPPDPGRPAGGPVDDDYPIGAVGGTPTSDGYNKETKISNVVGNSVQKIVEITPDNPVQHVQITPYRGSCNPDGSRDPLKIEVFLEKGGVSYKVPTDSILAGERQERSLAEYESLYDVNIYDPYWVARPWSIRQYDTRHKGDRTPRPIESPSGIPTFTCGLANNYDCYGAFKMYIEPETLNLVPNRCLSPVDMRFPNLCLKVFDADNPKDVNDPANMEVSTAGLQTGGRSKLVANVNAHGAGIQYLCTAINPSYGNMYIIQVNTDGTYIFWRLYEPSGDGVGSKVGALDPSDWLYTVRNNGTDVNGQGIPTRMPFKDTDGFLQGSLGSTLTTSLDDRDCSVGKGICDVCPLGDGFPPLGDISYNDRMGRFNSQIVDYQAPFMNGYRGYSFGVINTYGVPCLLSNWTEGSNGGEVCIPIQPQNSESDVQIRVYLNTTIFDYNSSLASTSMDTSNPTIHPPYFVQDDSPGIDYCGVTTVKVMPAAKLNFSEFRWIDNGLRFSEANYTTGTNATSPLDRPSAQLQHWYDPVCWNNKRDTYCYPGGQSHVARAVGNIRGGGFNAYPAINQNMWRKLGTEFYPLSDYSLYFVLNSPTDTNRCQEWDQYTLDASIAQNQPELSFLIIRSIEVKGPFMTPMKWFRPEQSWDGSTYARQRLTSEYTYNGIKNVPIRYDTSGYIKADYQNWQTYEYAGNWSTGDFTNIINPASDFQLDTHQALGVRLPKNRFLANRRDLVYVSSRPYLPFQSSAPNASHVFVFDEIIPIQPGNIEIKVTLANGDVKIYQDCCQVPPTDGIDVHALKIKLQNEDIEQRGGIFVDTPVTFKVNLTENEKVDPSNNQEWSNPECNDALVYAWQDRGCWDPDQNVWVGAGDGWLSNPPKNSDVYAQGVQYQPGDDKNKDGKVSFKDGETEIIGSYDITTNSWLGAYIDARTFQRNNGEYMLECSTKNNNLISSVGFDFGSMTPTGRPVPGGVKDHVIGWDETLPVWIVAYKYGDDNNDRSFRPLFDVLPDSTPSMSHEVYISGTRPFEVLPNIDLQMTYGPEPLTAGMQPELQAPDKPLTFTFTDAQGKPVDFSQGIPDGFGQSYVEDRNIEMHCFVDPHPDDEYYYGKGAHLPQYYWLRTDLHNYSGGIVSNAMLYSIPNEPFTPIKFQVKRDEQNRPIGYSFLGFCANDQGEFDVLAYTPDRKHSGKVTVKVKQPHVEYKIRNTETNQIFSVTGNPSASAKSEDPDFVMTAYDERIYEITVKCTDAQGQPIRGVAKEVSVCSGSGQDTARFTPFVTRPKEWEWATGQSVTGAPIQPGVAGYGVQYDVSTWQQVYWMLGDGNRFSPWIAIDINNDGKIDPILNKNNEIHRFYSMGAFQNASFGYYDMTSYLFENYNTTNFRFDDLRFDTRRAHDLPPTANRGWGLGAIYNNPYGGGYIFCDLNADRYLSYADSLSFNQNGEVSFFYYADDKMNVGGLVGNNIYSNSSDFSDLYGNPQWYAPLDPNKIYTRFRHGLTWWGDNWWGTNDGSFRLDWEAIPDNVVKVEAPIVKLYNPQTGEEASNDLLDPEYYDATYGKLNHFIVRAYPADPRDNKIKEESYVLTSNDRAYLPQGITSQHESLTLGRLHNSEVDPKAVETMISWRPTGTGKDVTSIFYARNINWNLRTNNVVTNPIMDNIFFIADSIRIDSCKGLDVKAEPLNKILRLGQTDTVIVTITEAGSGYRMEGAKVTLKSEDGTINLEQTSDINGEATFANVKPESLSKIIAKATMEGKVTGYAELFVDIDLTPPSINIDAFPGITNKTSITFTGDVTKGSTLKLNTVNAEVDATGKWKASYNLVSGENIITLVATGPNGAVRTTTIRVVLDKDPPKLVMPTQEQVDNYIINNEGKLKLSGRVDPESTVTVTYQQAGGNRIDLGVTVVNDFWQTTEFVPVAGTPLDVIVTAKDAAGNTTPASTATFKVLKVSTLKLTVGNTQKIFNGKADLLTQPPLLDKATGTPMVPVEELYSELGYVATFANGKLIITIDKYTADFTIGSTTATLNGNTVTLPVAPIVATNKALIPASFITKVLDMDTTSVNMLTYEPQGKVITIKRIWGK